MALTITINYCNDSSGYFSQFRYELASLVNMSIHSTFWHSKMISAISWHLPLRLLNWVFCNYFLAKVKPGHALALIGSDQIISYLLGVCMCCLRTLRYFILYMCNLICADVTSRHNSRTHARRCQLSVPCYRRSALGLQAFSVAGSSFQTNPAGIPATQPLHTFFFRKCYHIKHIRIRLGAM